MTKKNYIALLVLSCLFIFSCLESSKEEFIEQFISDLFNENITPEKVVETYIEVVPDTTKKTSLAQRLEWASDFIRETRKPMYADIEGNWLIPSHKIKQIKSPKVYSFIDYEHLSSIKINKIDSIKNRVFVLVDSEKEEILQYFLLNEDHTKILSYSLMVKDENDGTFFRPY